MINDKNEFVRLVNKDGGHVTFKGDQNEKIAIVGKVRQGKKISI